MTDKNPKLLKGMAAGWINIGLSLAPHKSSGKNVCNHASPICIRACLNTAGRGRMDSAQNARIRRTVLFREDPETFWSHVRHDIDRSFKKSDKVCVRMNVYSDLPWENIEVSGAGRSIMECYPLVKFYDYTKVPGRTVEGNYHLTFSLSETNEVAARKEMELGKNLAVVFREKPSEFWGVPVIDGDKNDLRFLDVSPAVVGLTPKGRMVHDTGGFVR